MNLRLLRSIVIASFTSLALATSGCAQEADDSDDDTDTDGPPQEIAEADIDETEGPIGTSTAAYTSLTCSSWVQRSWDGGKTKTIAFTANVNRTGDYYVQTRNV